MDAWPEEIHAEAYGRVISQLPALVKMLRQDVLHLRSNDAERLVVATWLMGYAGCLNDLHAVGGQLPPEELNVVMEWLTLRKQGQE